MSLKISVAVIGANGFLGSYLTKALLFENKNVIAVFNENNKNIDSKAKLMSELDFLKSNYEPTSIYFVAGNYSCSHLELLKINSLLYKISKRFLNSKLIYISSTNVYGVHDKTIKLNDSYGNLGLYAHSKLAGEFVALSHRKFVILRFTYIYGLGISNNSFIPRLINDAKTKGIITVFGDGSRKQDYMHIDDAVEFCIRSSKLPSNKILLGVSGKSVSNREVANILNEEIGCLVKYEGKETGSSFEFDAEESFELLNWWPIIEFENGLKSML
jgi:UDP-glucose 4-epimerase